MRVERFGGRGLYSTLFQEKPPEKKFLLLADFIKNWAPFIKNSILIIFTDPKAKRSENALYKHTVRSKTRSCFEDLRTKSIIMVKKRPFEKNED